VPEKVQCWAVFSVNLQRHQPSHSTVHHAGTLVLWCNTANAEASEGTVRVEERLHQDGRLVQERC